MLTCLHFVPSGHSTILEVDSVATVKIHYLPAEYSLDRGFHFLIPSRDDWDPNTFVHPEQLDIYTEDTKLDNLVGSGMYSGKLDLNISLRLPDFCSVFQADVMAIYGVAQWILVNGAPFTSVSVFSDSRPPQDHCQVLCITPGSLGNVAAISTTFLGTSIELCMPLVSVYSFGTPTYPGSKRSPAPPLDAPNP